ncbi:MAG TPA: TetR/AcrR family transcriptional regulator [Amycolatopsis sp.]|nr:TetR/AcrR family transcriptional regulator [Amycolatopsis sp.]
MARQGNTARRGRPRDPAIDTAILEAAITSLAGDGIDGFSMDRVAAAAGVSKVTVYARYANKLALIGAALRHLQFDGPTPTGDVRQDLITLLDTMRKQYQQVGAMSIAGSCLVMEPRSPELLNTVRDSTLLPRRARFARVLRAGVESGELREDLDIDRAVSLLFGCLYADHLGGLSTEPPWAEKVVDEALRGMISHSSGQQSIVTDEPETRETHAHMTRPRLADVQTGRRRDGRSPHQRRGS